MSYNVIMDLTDVDNLKVAMQLAGLRASKGLGQHFLVDRESLDDVMAAGKLTPEDTVIEIGPGLGVMTIPLTRAAKRVIAVEMDRSLADLLEQDRPDNLEVRQGDVLDLNLATLPRPYKVVANIPYYVTSKIFRLFLQSQNRPQLMSLLVQKEVAQRIVAEPGNMSILALSVQYYGAPRLTAVVERHKFWPPPKVDSAVLQVEVYERPVFEANEQKLFRLFKAGFGEKRKMLKNSLAGGLNISMELAVDLIAAGKLKPTARAQELSLGDWERLYRLADKHQII
jgi:16S rRNA (adenine1518-N6/adenine1519-N6)-dimethyltransferase